MVKRVEQPTEKFLCVLFKEDLDILRAMYGQQLGVGKAIRTIVHSYIRQTGAAAVEAIDNNATNTNKSNNIDQNTLV